MAMRVRAVAAAGVLAAALTGCASTVTGSGALGGSATATGGFPASTSTAATTAAPTTAAPTTAAPTTAAPTEAPTTAAPPSASATSAGAMQYLAKFVGQWIGHGRVMTIGATGRGLLTYRAYKNCSDDPTPPCDKIVNNEIQDGGRLTFQILQTITDNGNYGAEIQILTANDPSIDKSQPGGLGLDTHDVITADFFNQSTFCGPDAPAGACGA